jgi:YbbR domain-containing protein
MTTKQFNRLPVETIGLDPSLSAALTSVEVTVLLTGPRITLDSLVAEDVRVLLDLTGLEPGTYQIQPEVTVDQGQAVVSTITVVPAEINVIITGDEPTATPGD